MQVMKASIDLRRRISQMLERSMLNLGFPFDNTVRRGTTPCRSAPTATNRRGTTPCRLAPTDSQLERFYLPLGWFALWRVVRMKNKRMECPVAKIVLKSCNNNLLEQLRSINSRSRTFELSQEVPALFSNLIRCPAEIRSGNAH